MFNLKLYGFEDIEDNIKKYQDRVNEIKLEFEKMKKEEALGQNNYVGWMDLPDNYAELELNEIKSASEKIRQESDVLIVAGIGGSYLGAEAIIDALQKRDDKLEIIFLGNSISERDLEDTIEYIKDKDYSLNVISKSGTTLETALAFRVLKNEMIKKYKEEYIDRIYITTDKEKGALKEFANANNLKTFIVPDNIGGRYSVLTPVGLLPIACAGIDIEKLINGSKKAKNDFNDIDVLNNPAIKYAVLRNILYFEKKYVVENIVNYEPRCEGINNWFVQLFGESEGKDGKGLYPTSTIFTRDLHSLGQFIQDGPKMLFETIIYFNKTGNIKVLEDKEDLDNLNYLTGKSIAEINKIAMMGTIKAHVDGGVPNILIEMEKLDEENLGYLIYFFMLSCAYSARILDVDPFNQPGVEAYKKNVFQLLGRPGY